MSYGCVLVQLYFMDDWTVSAFWVLITNCVWLQVIIILLSKCYSECRYSNNFFQKCISLYFVNLKSNDYICIIIADKWSVRACVILRVFFFKLYGSTSDISWNKYLTLDVKDNWPKFLFPALNNWFYRATKYYTCIVKPS